MPASRKPASTRKAGPPPTGVPGRVSSKGIVDATPALRKVRNQEAALEAARWHAHRLLRLLEGQGRRDARRSALPRRASRVAIPGEAALPAAVRAVRRQGGDSLLRRDLPLRRVRQESLARRPRGPRIRRHVCLEHQLPQALPGTLRSAPVESSEPVAAPDRPPGPREVHGHSTRLDSGMPRVRAARRSVGGFRGALMLRSRAI
jgi:hypothetical protein